MSANNDSGGVSLGTVVLVVFVILKLTHTIDWSWWWVLSPLWIGFAIALVLLIPVAFGALFLSRSRRR